MGGFQRWELLAKAHTHAWEKYKHPLVVVGIDVYNLEPEAYGAVIDEPKGVNIPSIHGHPCEEIDEFLELELFEPENVARIQEVLSTGKEIQKHCAEAEVRVPVCGPFALAIGLLGMNELLMSLVEDREELVAGLEHLLEGQKRYLRAIHESGLRPIIFESGTTPPLLPVEAFESIEAPLLAELFAYCAELFGEAPPCVIGGDATPIAHALLAAKPGYVIAPSEADQRAFCEIAKDYPEVHVRVNFPAASLLEDSTEKLDSIVAEAIEIAKLRENTCVGCGVVPYETEPAAVLAVRELVEPVLA